MDAVTKRECSIISRTKTYSPDETILGDDIGLPTYSYLITKGTCCIIEHLQVVVYYVNGIKKYKLYIPNDSNKDIVGDKPSRICSIVPSMDKKKKKSTQKCSIFQTKPLPKGTKEAYTVETHFIKVCEFTEGAIFNVGENFERRRVVAETNTNCLLIPRYWLIKMNKDNIWNRVQQFLNNNIPSTKKIFQEWVKDRKFVAYSQKLVKHIMAQKKVSNTNCIHNVPYSIRLKENSYYNFQE